MVLRYRIDIPFFSSHTPANACVHFLYKLKWKIVQDYRYNIRAAAIIDVPKDKLDFFRALCNEAGIEPTLLENNE